MWYAQARHGEVCRFIILVLLAPQFFGVVATQAGPEKSGNQISFILVCIYFLYVKMLSVFYAGIPMIAYSRCDIFFQKNENSSFWY